MGNMRFKVGDRVRIKSIDWYNENKNHCGEIPLFKPSGLFMPDMSRYCNNIMTIKDICYGTCYRMKEDFWNYNWTDEMIECKVEVEEKTKFGTALNPIELKSNANCSTRERVDDTKPEPKFKVGDKVILDPYPCVVTDVNWRDSLHGFVYTVRGVDFGKMVGEEDLVFDERTFPNTNEIIKSIKTDWTNFKDRWDIPNEYHFVDKNGNEIDISEIVLEKKKKEYPKTYEECAKIMNCPIAGPSGWLFNFDANIKDTYYRKIDILMGKFTRLLICRDAYWELYGEEMGLGKPWEPDWEDENQEKYIIGSWLGTIQGLEENFVSHPFAFPTEEMRDAFYENFKEEIEICKELL